MSKAQRIDPFVSGEAEVRVDAGISRILRQRIKSAAGGRTVSAKAARHRIQKWLLKSSTTKPRQPIWKKLSCLRMAPIKDDPNVLRLLLHSPLYA